MSVLLAGPSLCCSFYKLSRASIKGETLENIGFFPKSATHSSRPLGNFGLILRFFAITNSTLFTGTGPSENLKNLGADSYLKTTNTTALQVVGIYTSSILNLKSRQYWMQSVLLSGPPVRRSLYERSSEEGMLIGGLSPTTEAPTKHLMPRFRVSIVATIIRFVQLAKSFYGY